MGKPKANGIELLEMKAAIVKENLVLPLSPEAMVHVAQPQAREDVFEVYISISLPIFDDPTRTPVIEIAHKPSKEINQGQKAKIRDLYIRYASQKATQGPYHQWHLQITYRLQKNTKKADGIRVRPLLTDEQDLPNPV